MASAQAGEGCVDVLAGQHHSGYLGQRRQDRIDIRAGQRAGVDHGIGVEFGDGLDVVGKLVSIGVQVLYGDPRIGLSVATVHYQHGVTTVMQPLGNPAAEEPGIAQHQPRIR